MKVPTRGALGAIVILAAVGLASPAEAQEVPETQEGEHVVRRGDTLWDIARRYLQNPFLWNYVFEANRDVVQNPHLIFPDDRISIPGLPGDATAVELPADEAPRTVEAPPERTRFYTPSVADEPEPESSPEMVDHDAPEMESTVIRQDEFRAAPWIAEPATLSFIGELITVVEREQLPMRPHSALPYDRVFLNYQSTDRPEIDDELVLVREGRSYRGYGKVIRPTGIVRVIAIDDEVFEAVIEDQFEQVIVGDLALPIESFPGPIAKAENEVEAGPEGEIIGFYDEPEFAKMYGAIFVDLGESDGLQIGDELVAFLPERKAGGGYGEQLPPEPVANLRVVRVEERSATVKVMQKFLPWLEPGLPVRLVTTGS